MPNRFLLFTLPFLLWFTGCQPSAPKEQSISYADSSAYHANRQTWLSRDQAHSFSSGMVLSSQELVLDRELEKVTKKMREDYQKEHFFPPARPFYLSKTHISQTALFHWLRKMPKGGLLHIHDTALGSAWHIVETACKVPDCYVFWEENQGGYVKGQLQFFKPGEAPEGFLAVQQLAASDPEFKQELFSLLTFDAGIMADSVDVWTHFEQQFQRRLGFINYQPLFKDHFIAAFDSLLADGISYVELRVILHDGLYDLEHPAGYFPADSMLAYYQDILAATRVKAPGFNLKIIYTGLRFFDRDAICNDLNRAYAMRKRNPDFLVGYDLVGQEDAGYPTLYHLDCWLNMDSLEQVYGVDMPLFLHDGESAWPDNDNLYDALLLHTRRIGHGFNLYRYPNLEQVVKDREVCLEICPLSNQIMGYVSDLRNHPAVGYLNRGIPCTLSTDDPSIFAYDGLTYDFWAATLAWGLDLAALKQLARNSLVYSSLSPQEKEDALKSWELAWEEWSGVSIR